MARSGPIGIAVVLALIILLWIALYLGGRRGPGVNSAAEQCRAEYHRARTAAETAMVDRLRPISGRAGAGTALNCRTLRTSGGIRP